MKQILFSIAFLVGGFAISEASAQSCCAAKSATCKSGVTEVKADQTGAKTVAVASISQKGGTTAVNTAPATATAKTGKATCNPGKCDVTKCEPGKCDLSKCEPGKCAPNGAKSGKKS